jgi:hypothetical protein
MSMGKAPCPIFSAILLFSAVSANNADASEACSARLNVAQVREFTATSNSALNRINKNRLMDFVETINLRESRSVSDWIRIQLCPFHVGRLLPDAAASIRGSVTGPQIQNTDSYLQVANAILHVHIINQDPLFFNKLRGSVDAAFRSEASQVDATVLARSLREVSDILRQSEEIATLNSRVVQPGDAQNLISGSQGAVAP